ncbi:MAG: hypothetical protein SW127_18035 [Actinomycetota bacterium]|nr:hypothetical protein [Actinomycetota bacterium]
MTTVAIALGVMGLLCVNWLIRTLANGEPLTSLIAFGASIFTFGLAANMYRTKISKSVIPRVDVVNGTTVLEPDSRCAYYVLAAVCGMILSGTLFAVLAPLHRVDLELTDGQRLFFSVGAAFVAALCVPALIRSLRHGGPRITLDSNHLDLYNGKHWTSFRWDDIDAILDYVPHGKSNTGCPITIVAVDGRAFTLETPDSYTHGGITLFWMLRHYWLTPEDRDELADGRAAERFLSARFETR